MKATSKDGEPLIVEVMRGGKRVAAVPTLAQIRERAARDLARLPEPLRQLQQGVDYPVAVGEALKDLAVEADRLTKR